MFRTDKRYPVRLLPMEVSSRVASMAFRGYWSSGARSGLILGFIKLLNVYHASSVEARMDDRERAFSYVMRRINRSLLYSSVQCQQEAVSTYRGRCRMSEKRLKTSTAEYFDCILASLMRIIDG
jgi:hypothetical protein